MDINLNQNDIENAILAYTKNMITGPVNIEFKSGRGMKGVTAIISTSISEEITQDYDEVEEGSNNEGTSKLSKLFTD